MSKRAVDTFIREAPAEHRDDLREIRKMIREAMPGAVETMGPSGFPVYTDDDGNWLAGFATRKPCAMLYVMAPGVLDRHADRLGTLRSGKSCVRYRASRAVSKEELVELSRVMLAEAWGS